MYIFLKLQEILSHETYLRNLFYKYECILLNSLVIFLTIFIPAPKPTAPTMCIEPQEPECGFGQIMKAIIDADGCHKFICRTYIHEASFIKLFIRFSVWDLSSKLHDVAWLISECLPVNECPTFNELSSEVEQLQPGFVQVMNTSGCCPRPTKLCDPTTCPPAPKCPDYYNTTAIVLADSCCSTYECGIVSIFLTINTTCWIVCAYVCIIIFQAIQNDMIRESL